MSTTLHDLIQTVRECKSASSERAVIAKELANIRTKNKTKYGSGVNIGLLRYQNVGKLMYCDLLGYPTYFGQMEVLKLLASKPFGEKRLGYLALMALLNENTEILTLCTNCLQQDMLHENPYIVGLALCAIGNVASIQLSRDLARTIEQLLTHYNPYIRKKALCAAIRIVHHVPEMCSEYFKAALANIGEGHGTTVAAAQLLYSICQICPRYGYKLRRYSNQIVTRLNALLHSSSDPNDELSDVNDPFLQVHLLKLLRVISTGDKLHCYGFDFMWYILQNYNNNNAGFCKNGVLYECISTTMAIQKQSGLHVLAIDILGDFLINDNVNMRYIALNALRSAAVTNQYLIQKHWNAIVNCLNDEVLTIRRLALDLIYTLSNKNNIQSMSRDLLSFLVYSNTATTSLDMLSSEELEFRRELASKISIMIERYAPNRKWYIDAILQVLGNTATIGFNREQQIVSDLFVKITNSLTLQSYCTYKLYECIDTLQLDSDSIRQITAWIIGEYGDKLLNSTDLEQANQVFHEHEDTAYKIKVTKNRDKLSLITVDADDNVYNGFAEGMRHRCLDYLVMGYVSNKILESKNMYIYQMDIHFLIIQFIGCIGDTPSVGPFVGRKTADEIISILEYIITHNKSTETTKGFGLTALMKIRHKYQASNIDKEDKIKSILQQFKYDNSIEIQQRAIEYLVLFENTDQMNRDKIFKPMPTPIIKQYTEIDHDTDTMYDTSSSSSSSSSTSSPSSSPQPIYRRRKPLKRKVMIPVLCGPDEVSDNDSNDGQQQDKSQAFEAYNNDGICVMFNFVATHQNGICRILAVFSNRYIYEIDNFQFMVATPKYMKLQIKAANGSKLLPLSQNSITQKFQLTNTMYGEKPFVIRIQVSYSQNGKQKRYRSQVYLPQNCC